MTDLPLMLAVCTQNIELALSELMKIPGLDKNDATRLQQIAQSVHDFVQSRDLSLERNLIVLISALLRELQIVLKLFRDPDLPIN